MGQLNAREGVREEKWVSFDLRTLKFPSTHDIVHPRSPGKAE